MTPSLTATPEIIKCRTTADFLAALPLLVGFTATNSIFIVLFSGKAAGRTIRLDLPPDDSPTTTAPLLDFISDTLQGLSALSGFEPLSPAIVITTDLRFPVGGPAPWHRFARRLERRLRRDGFTLRELCCLAADGWIGFLAPDAPACGRPLSEIADSPVARRHRAEIERVPDLSVIAEIPAADPHRAAAVVAALEGLRPYETSRPEADSSWMLEVADVGEKLREGRCPLAPADTAKLIRTAAHSDRWLVLVLGLLTRPVFPYELSLDPDLPGRFDGLPIDLDDGSHRPPKPGWSILRILTSVCPGFSEQHRLSPLLDTLLSAISETPPELRPSLLAMSALLWWLNGNQTVAQRHLDTALALDPQHGLSRTVEKVVSVPLYSSMIRASQHSLME